MLLSTWRLLWTDAGAGSEELHRECDMFAFCLLSHGEDGVFYTKDKSVKLETLFRLFRADNCRGLLGKPKLFFIQVRSPRCSPHPHTGPVPLSSLFSFSLFTLSTRHSALNQFGLQLLPLCFVNRFAHLAYFVGLSRQRVWWWCGHARHWSWCQAGPQVYFLSILLLLSSSLIWDCTLVSVCMSISLSR